MLIAKRSGRRIGILDLTKGELSTRGTLETRAKETEEASKILGLDWRENFGFADGNIEITQENILRIVGVIRTLRPSILLTPHYQERHPDHEATSELAKRAVFYAGLAKIETIGSDGRPHTPFRPLLTLQFMQTFTFDPKIIIDVSEVFSDRVRAVTVYSSQFGRKANGEKIESRENETFLTQSGFFEWIEARARHYGMMIGAEYGEPFWAHEPLGVKDPFSLLTKKIA